MLNASDIEYMKEAQDEVYTLRQRPLSVIYVEKEYDDITGQLIGEVEHSRDVQAVITEISTRSKDGSRYVEGGIEYEQGDIKVDIKLAYIEDIADKLMRASYGDKKYELLGGDKKGIGKRNRVEYVGRVIA